MPSNSTPTILASAAIVVSLGVAGYVALSTQSPPETAATATEPAQSAPVLGRAEVESIVKGYLISNPEIMVEVQQALEKKREEERIASQQKTLAEQHAAIFKSNNQTDIGNPDAPITIVEFFDYNCGYCQRALEDMQQFIENQPDVRFVLREFPVLGDASLQAHRVSLAFGRLHPEKAAEFHTALLSAPGRKDGEVATKLAVALGADEAAILAEVQKPYVTDAIRDVYQIADALGITGTPSYVVGEEVVFGAVGYSSLSEKVEAIRSCSETVSC